VEITPSSSLARGRAEARRLTSAADSQSEQGFPPLPYGIARNWAKRQTHGRPPSLGSCHPIAMSWPSDAPCTPVGCISMSATHASAYAFWLRR
jgi:hypothetical protein